MGTTQSNNANDNTNGENRGEVIAKQIFFARDPIHSIRIWARKPGPGSIRWMTMRAFSHHHTFLILAFQKLKVVMFCDTIGYRFDDFMLNPCLYFDICCF